MYVPAIALAKRHKLMVAYWRTPYIHSDGRGWMLNDAFGLPDNEIQVPRPVTLYKLEDGNSSTASELKRNVDGTYYYNTVGEAGPKITLEGYANGRGHDAKILRTQNVFASDHTWVTDPNPEPGYMLGPSPADPTGESSYTQAELNPVGITGYPFTVAFWVKILDNEYIFNEDATGIPPSDSTSAAKSKKPLLSIRRWKSSGGSWGPSNSWFANIEVSRYGPNTSDGCFAIHARHHASSDDGTRVLEARSKVSRDPIGHVIGSEEWCYVAAVFDRAHINLYVNGILVDSMSRSRLHNEEDDIGSAPGSFNWPDQDHFQIALNHDLLDDTRNGVPRVAMSHLCVWDQEVDAVDLMRHTLVFRRFYDMRLPYNLAGQQAGEFHHGVPMDRIYSWNRLRDGVERSWFEPAGMAKFRHDGRFAAVYHLKNPQTDLRDPLLNWNSEDPSPPGQKNEQCLVPRTWTEHPPTAAQNTVQEDMINWTFCTQLLMIHMGGYQWGFDNPEYKRNGSGGSLICGICADLTPGSTKTMLLNCKGQAPDGALNWANYSGCQYVTTDIYSGIDGLDGFALWIDSGNISESVNPAVTFWCPYETKTSWGSPSPIDGEYYDAVLGNARANEYKIAEGSDLTNLHHEFFSLGIAFGREVNEPPLRWVLDPPFNKGLHLRYTQSSASDMDNWESGDALARFPRVQSAFYQTMYYCLNTVEDSDTPDFDYAHIPPGAFQNSDTTPTSDYNRYGPWMLFAEKLPESRIKYITRIMHGQPLMRSRPPVRGVNRHFAYNAPTRILT